MTTFTPPTEFPHECLDSNGDKVTLFALDTNGRYVCLWHSKFGDAFADIQKPENLRDLPKVTSTWQNVYPSGASPTVYFSKSKAVSGASNGSIGVLRIDKIDGVTTCTLEEV